MDNFINWTIEDFKNIQERIKKTKGTKDNIDKDILYDDYETFNYIAEDIKDYIDNLP